MDLRQRREGLFQRKQVAGVCRAERNTADQTLQVIDRAESGPQVRAKLMVVLELRHDIEASLDLSCIHERVQEPFAQFSAAHGRDRVIEHGKKRSPGGTVIDIPDQFQVPLAGRIDDHMLFGPEGLHPADVRQAGLLRFLDIPERGAGRRDAGLHTAAAEPFKRCDLEMVQTAYGTRSRSQRSSHRSR